MAGRGFDFTQTGGLRAACEWIRKGSGALMVVAIRVEDSAIDVDPEMPLKDVMPRLELEVLDLTNKLMAAREAAREKKKEDWRD